LMKFNVLVSDVAQRQIYEIEEKTKHRLIKTLRELEKNSFKTRSGADIKKLKGSRNPSLYRLRVGEFRIIYSVNKKEVRVTEIMKRSKGYEWID